MKRTVLLLCVAATTVFWNRFETTAAVQSFTEIEN